MAVCFRYHPTTSGGGLTFRYDGECSRRCQKCKAPIAWKLEPALIVCQRNETVTECKPFRRFDLT